MATILGQCSVLCRLFFYTELIFCVQSISLKSQPSIDDWRSVVCSPCIMCPTGHYPPQHKQAGLQIQRNTNRNAARNPPSPPVKLEYNKYSRPWIHWVIMFSRHPYEVMLSFMRVHGIQFLREGDNTSLKKANMLLDLEGSKDSLSSSRRRPQTIVLGWCCLEE